MEAVSDVYTIPQEHLDFCTTIGQIARERIAPRSAEIDEKAEYPWDVRKLLAGLDKQLTVLAVRVTPAGSQLSIDETRDIAPYQNATGLQVTSAVLAGMVWALENPDAGIVEADEMDCCHRGLDLAQHVHFTTFRGEHDVARSGAWGQLCR